MVFNATQKKVMNGERVVENLFGSLIHVTPENNCLSAY